MQPVVGDEMMRGARPLAFLLTALMAAPAAEAAPTLIAIGTLNGAGDLSGLGAPMENGVPGDILGGLGSGLAYAGGNTFLALPDRGPNATPYNTAVDNTASYIGRFQTMTLGLTPGAPGSTLPYAMTPTLTGTMLLYSATPLTYGTGAGLGNKLDGMPLGSGAPAQNTADKFYFTGRSDNFDPAKNSGNPGNARLDPEAIRVANDGRSVFVTDEYGPYIYQFDRATGERIRTYTLPDKFYVDTLAPRGSVENNPANNTKGRTANQGMEGLAITPDGKTLIGMMQSGLRQDVIAGTNKLARIVTIDIATGATKEYAYPITSGTGVSEILAINDHEFLVIERDGTGLGDGSAAIVKKLYRIDLTGATEISGLSTAEAVAVAVPKTEFLDLKQALNDFGLADTEIPSKIEGLAFGPDVTLHGTVLHTLYIANDNDFLPDVAGPNVFYVFGFTDSDLPGFVPQQLAVAEPSSIALLVGAMLGLGLWRRRSAARG